MFKSKKRKIQEKQERFLGELVEVSAQTIKILEAAIFNYDEYQIEDDGQFKAETKGHCIAVITCVALCALNRANLSPIATTSFKDEYFSYMCRLFALLVNIDKSLSADILKEAYELYSTKKMFVDPDSGELPDDSDQVTGVFLNFINEANQLENVKPDLAFKIDIYGNLASFYISIQKRLNTYLK